MAGPCSVESEKQLCTVAESVKKERRNVPARRRFQAAHFALLLQGLEADGLMLLREARKLTGLPIVTEIMSDSQLDEFGDVDILQVGARNMQNFRLLKAIGQTKKPVLLKRGLSATIEEWLMSAEYIMAGGNENVILCERGIRTFEHLIRNNLDISAVPLIKHSHLPILIDPSHAAGIAWMVEPLAKGSHCCGRRRPDDRGAQ